MDIGSELGIFTVAICLLVFGTGYNFFVNWLEEKHYHEGYVSLLVVVGVAATLIGVAVLNWRAALVTLICFMASGTPMIVGSTWRYIRQRERAQKAIIRDSAKTVAQQPTH